MNPVSLGGFPLEPTIGASPPLAPPSTPAAASDMVSLEGTTTTTPMAPPRLPTSADPALAASPRPWPPDVSSMPRAGACAALFARGPADVTAGLLSPGGIGTGLLPSLQERAAEAPHQPRGKWNAEPTPQGWRVPRNPNRTPVQPRPAYEVREGTDDLGPLKVVPNTHGRIRALRLQWPEEYQEPAYGAQHAVLHDVLTRMPPDVTIHIVAEGMSAGTVQKLVDQLPAPHRVHVHPMQIFSTPQQLVHPLTMWARDGALLMHTDDRRDVLLLPHAFRGDTQVSASLNRRVVQATGAAPARLQSALPELIVRRSSLNFEGGDIVASRRAVLVGGNTIAASMASMRLSRTAVIERFTRELGREVIAIEPQPEFHVDLGFTFLDDETVAVADPGDTIRRVAHDPQLTRQVVATRDLGLAEKYDSAAAMLAALGLQVVRLPNLAGLGLLTSYLTYNNVLMERFDDIQRVFMPVYDVAALDDMARAIYALHGFTVIDMPSSRASTLLWGGLRCATGELAVE